jgi:hypothetical protein
MSAASLLQSKFHLRVIKGGRAQTKPKEILCTRADGLHFRGQTLAIVRHYFEISCQVGRLPSILGREFFRAKVSHHGIPSFEEQAVFVHDVEQAMARLNPQDLEVVSLVGLYHYSLDEAAILLGRCRTTVTQRYAGAIDTLAQVFLEAGLLREGRPDRHIQRFNSDGAEPKEEDLALKKRAASIMAEPALVVTEETAKYSFVARQEMA